MSNYNVGHNKNFYYYELQKKTNANNKEMYTVIKADQYFVGAQAQISFEAPKSKKYIFN